MPKQSICRFVLGMRTRHPFAVDVITIITNAGTNGVALTQALASPDIQAAYGKDQIGIVRVSESGPHLSKDLDKFCRKVGLADPDERAVFMYKFAQDLLDRLRNIEERRS